MLKLKLELAHNEFLSIPDWPQDNELEISIWTICGFCAGQIFIHYYGTIYTLTVHRKIMSVSDNRFI